MVIKASAAGEIRRLVEDLASDREVQREAAIARLTVIGARAVDRLVAALASPSPVVRTAALRALEAIGDARALKPALTHLDDPEADVAVAAVGVARGFLRSPHESAVLDRLAALAMDRTRDRRRRLAALIALDDLPPDTIGPIHEQLRLDPDQALAAHAAGAIGPDGASDPAAALEAAAAGRLPRDPATVRAWLTAAAAETPLATVHRLIGVVRTREAAEAADARRPWTDVRGAAHLLLARRDSRVALYDLRETLERADGPLPPDLMTAVAAIGDASCLEPLAALYARARQAGADPMAPWPARVRETLQAIVRRERLTRRHAAVRRLQSRWPAEAAWLLGKS